MRLYKLLLMCISKISHFFLERNFLSSKTFLEPNGILQIWSKFDKKPDIDIGT